MSSSDQVYWEEKGAEEAEWWMANIPEDKWPEPDKTFLGLIAVNAEVNSFFASLTLAQQKKAQTDYVRGFNQRKNNLV